MFVMILGIFSLSLNMIPKDVFRNLRNIATKESFFMFNDKFYKLMMWLWGLHWAQL